MASRVSLSAFLSVAKSALTASASKKQPLTFVVGNESADLDSLCSALLLAYLRTAAPPYTLHIPLCHLHRDDLTLRPEFTEVLKSASASPDDVITLDELSEAANAPGFKDNTHWLLVDHNVLAGKLEPYKERVIGCIDHHVDEQSVPQHSSPRVIETSGSCASLVVKHCREAWDQLKEAENAPEIDAQIAHLALAPILIDTTNLTDKNKTTPYDVDAVEYLKGKINSASFDSTGFFNAVSVLKEDISPLPMRDVLRKDYKEWQDAGLKLGTSSVTASFSQLQEKAGDVDKLDKVIDEWGEEKSLDLVAVMTTFEQQGQFSRELLLLARTANGVEAAKRFESQCQEQLGLSIWSEGKLHSDEENKWLRCWAQANVANSRKQVAPMLRKAMQAQEKN